MRQPVKYIFRILVGVIFLISSIAKIVSIDSFELYIFSFEILGLSVSFLFARLVIAFELALGVYLIVNLDAKVAYALTCLFLAGMSVFLIVLIIMGNNGNCNCFGELIAMNPWQSLIKNVIIFAILLLSVKLQSFNIRYKPLWRVMIIVAAIATVFILRPPDNWYYESYGKSTTFNREAFDQRVESNVLPSEIMEGDKVICFYSLSCEFCKMSAHKIGTMRRLGTFPQSEIVAFIGLNDISGRKEEATQKAITFFEETKLDCEKFYFIEPKDFLRFTNGSMPLILVMKDGEVIAKYSYRDIR